MFKKYSLLFKRLTIYLFPTLQVERKGRTFVDKTLSPIYQPKIGETISSIIERLKQTGRKRALISVRCRFRDEHGTTDGAYWEKLQFEVFPDSDPFVIAKRMDWEIPGFVSVTPSASPDASYELQKIDTIPA